MMELSPYKLTDEQLQKTEVKVEFGHTRRAKAKPKLWLSVWLEGQFALLDRMPTSSVKITLFIVARWRAMHETTCLSSTTAEKVGVSRQAMRGFKSRLAENSDWFVTERKSDFSAPVVYPTPQLMELLLKI